MHEQGISEDRFVERTIERKSTYETHANLSAWGRQHIERERKGKGGGGGVGTHAYPQTRRTVSIGMMQMSTPTISSGRIASTVECFRDRRTEVSLLQIGNHHHHQTVFPSNKISLMWPMFEVRLSDVEEQCAVAVERLENRENKRIKMLFNLSFLSCHREMKQERSNLIFLSSSRNQKNLLHAQWWNKTQWETDESSSATN